MRIFSWVPVEAARTTIVRLLAALEAAVRRWLIMLLVMHAVDASGHIQST